MAMSALASACTKALSTGLCSSDGRSSLLQQFPGCCLVSISVPSMASKNLLVTAGNMARDSQMQISFLSMHAAAAGLALAERRWFHISKSRASRMDKYKDLKMACLRHGCEQVLYVPILPQLPDGHVAQARQPKPKPPPSAFGVLTLGFDSSVLMDARLLTTTFLLAHLMAQDLIRQAPAMLIRMQSSPALPSEAAPEQPDRRAGIPPSSSWAGSLAGPSFPAKRALEPATFANGVFRPSMDAPSACDVEQSRPSSTPSKRHMIAPRAMHVAAHDRGGNLDQQLLARPGIIRRTSWDGGRVTSLPP
ncbi:g6042 [Coccomyxa viridis]|uniref:G6042 protein n=1 Tax=Coccomyxa viridis TaxID=1274662 RepID=A0ABP1FYD1_9CHLO